MTVRDLTKYGCDYMEIYNQREELLYTTANQHIPKNYQDKKVDFVRFEDDGETIIVILA